MNVLKVAAVNVLVLLLGLVVVELVFGTWFSEVHALHQFTKPRNVHLVHKNPLSDTPPEIRYTRDDNGFRGLDTSVDKIDLITVGGSTTDQRWIDDSETFQAVLKSQFKKDGKDIHVANAGIDGQSTFGHIHNFSSWLKNIDGLKTRYILYYVGINDIMKTNPDGTFDTIAADNSRLKLQLVIREKSALYQLYLISRRILVPDKYDHSLDRRNIATDGPFTTKGNIRDYNLPEFTASLKALDERITELASLTRALGAKPIFVTQRSARWKSANGEIVGISDYKPDFHEEAFRKFGSVNGVDIYNIERRIADTVLTACGNAGAICLDLMSEIQFDIGQDFYDPIHTTPAGSRVIGEYLHERLKPLL